MDLLFKDVSGRIESDGKILAIESITRPVFGKNSPLVVENQLVETVENRPKVTDSKITWSK